MYLKRNPLASQTWIDLKNNFSKAYEAFFVTKVDARTQHDYTSNMLALGLLVVEIPTADGSLNTIRNKCSAHTMAQQGPYFASTV